MRQSRTVRHPGAVTIAVTGADRPVISKPRLGTDRLLCVQSFGSAEYRRLEAHATGAAKHPGVHILETHRAGQIRNVRRLAAKAHDTELRSSVARSKITSHRSGNGRVKAVRQGYAWASEHDLVSTNPARDVAYLRSNVRRLAHLDCRRTSNWIEGPPGACASNLHGRTKI